MDVLILSDTHLSDAARLPTAVLEAARRADHIVHAGDLSTFEIVEVLRRYAPVTAVHGNVDDGEVLARLDQRAEVDLDGVRIGVVHDAGSRQQRHERLQQMFPDCSVVVYGHSHAPEAELTAQGTWIVNPGSPTQRRRSPFHSIAWLTCARGQARVDIVDIDAG